LSQVGKINLMEDFSYVLRMGTQILEKFGHIDLLINNAGFGEFGKVENESIERIEAVMRTNYFGMVYCSYNLCSRDTPDIL